MLMAASSPKGHKNTLQEIIGMQKIHAFENHICIKLREVLKPKLQNTQELLKSINNNSLNYCG